MACVYQAASFRQGVMIAGGQPVFALVETGEAWVDANFKETQLADLATGQSAEIVFDAAPGQTFSGKVEAIGAGTGAEFSLLPAQNATGNWVKVTQRVPVRIRLDDPAAAANLASGVSAEVTVDTRPAAVTTGGGRSDRRMSDIPESPARPHPRGPFRPPRWRSSTAG
jgi:membrane fusion protein (multidrug efflux system)